MYCLYQADRDWRSILQKNPPMSSTHCRRLARNDFRPSSKYPKIDLMSIYGGFLISMCNHFNICENCCVDITSLADAYEMLNSIETAVLQLPF